MIINHQISWRQVATSQPLPAFVACNNLRDIPKTSLLGQIANML